MTGLTIGLHPGYVSGRAYLAAPTDGGLITQTVWAPRTLYASCFTVSASITVNTLPLMLVSNVPINNLKEAGSDAIYPGYNTSIYANGSGSRPSGAPLGSTGYQPLARMLTPLASSIALTAGLYWMITEFYQQSQQPFPAVMALGGASGGSIGGAALLGIASIGTDPRTIAGLSLGGQPGGTSIAAPTLTGSEAWQDLPPGVGAPAVFMGL